MPRMTTWERAGNKWACGVSCLLHLQATLRRTNAAQHQQRCSQSPRPTQLSGCTRAARPLRVPGRPLLSPSSANRARACLSIVPSTSQGSLPLLVFPSAWYHPLDGVLRRDRRSSQAFPRRLAASAPVRRLHGLLLVSSIAVDFSRPSWPRPLVLISLPCPRILLRPGSRPALVPDHPPDIPELATITARSSETLLGTEGAFHLIRICLRVECSHQLAQASFSSPHRKAYHYSATRDPRPASHSRCPVC